MIVARERTTAFQSTRPARGATGVAHARRAHEEFQSTRPARGATWLAPSALATRPSFNPRAPRGARLAAAARLQGGHDVSIHAPRAGRDFAMRQPPSAKTRVSIHAPRAGRDRGRSKRRSPGQFRGWLREPAPSRHSTGRGLQSSGFQRAYSSALLGIANRLAAIWTLRVRASPQAMSGPSRSSTALIPWCSTCPFQLLPMK